MHLRRVRSILLLAALVALTIRAGNAVGYEFEIHTRTIGQGYSLRSFRLLGPNLSLDRRRFTQVLNLSLWDLQGGRPHLVLHGPEPKGPRVYFTAYMRIDHDFGDYTTGSLVWGGRNFDAVDLIPELESDSLALDLLYGYLAVDGLLDGRLDLKVGRQMQVDALDWLAMDGASGRLVTPFHVAVEAYGGLRVRDSSPLGSATHELDGTSGAECAEYVEGATPGSGSWRPIDRGIPGETNPFTNDFDLCPQREKLQPTFGGALETDGVGPLWARVSYRRTVSRTVGLIGPVDRFAYPDTGLYPDEVGQAPKWGVNEEAVAATVRTRRTFADRRGNLTAYAGGRYSLLHGLIDAGHAGARIGYRAHAAEAEVYYSYPTFDGDSIFNVFSSEPYTDYRLTYDLAPEKAPWRSYLRGWMRRYRTEDPLPDDQEQSDLAGGVQAGARYRIGRELIARIDLFHEDGYGGRRSGGYGAARWLATSRVGVSTRLGLVDFAADTALNPSATSFSAEAGVSYVVNPSGVTFHLLGEEIVNRYDHSQFRVIGVVDLAFEPET